MSCKKTAKRHIKHYIKNAACIACMIFLAYESWNMRRLLNMEVETGYFIVYGLVEIGFGITAGLLFLEYFSGKNVPKAWMITLTAVLGFSTIMSMAYGSGAFSVFFDYPIPPSLFNALFWFIMAVRVIFGIWLVIFIVNIVGRSKASKETASVSREVNDSPGNEDEAVTEDRGVPDIK